MNYHKLIYEVLKGQPVIVKGELEEKTIFELIQNSSISYQKHITPEGTPGYVIRDYEYDFIWFFIPLDVANTRIKDLLGVTNGRGKEV